MRTPTTPRIERALPILALTLVAAHPVAATELADVLAEGAEVEKLAGDFRFTEGPAWSPDGYLLFSDIPANRILRYEPGEDVSGFLEPSENSNGLVFDAAGRLWACQHGARRIVRIDPDAEAKEQIVVADTYDGKKLNTPNDLALDGTGGLYFTDPRYGEGPPVEQPVTGVYWVSPKGDVKLVIGDLSRPNGILVSPDGESLTVAEADRGRVWRYTIESPGELGEGDVIFEADPELDGRGGPDGMAHDAAGRIYATFRDVTVLEKDGTLIGRIDIPEQPANCTIGGADGKTLFVTARTSLYAVDLAVEKAPLAETGPGIEGDDAKTTKAAKSAEKTVKHDFRGLSLAVPASWEKVDPGPRSLRLGEFRIASAEGDEEGAEVSVFFFGRALVDANVERWLGQFDAGDREGTRVSGEVDAGRYTLVDLEGTYLRPVGPPIRRQTERTPGWRVVNALIEASDGGAWFIKVAGPKRTVSRAMDAFRASFGADDESVNETTPIE